MNIVVFFKEPIPGQVKTRLAKSIGAKTAATIYERLLRHNLDIIYALKTLDFKVLPFIGNEPSASFRQHFEQQYSEIFLQAPGDLGMKMHASIKTVANYNNHPTLIVGTDTLGLSPGVFLRAKKIISHKDAVIGPALDGGYYLIGLKKANANLFLNRAWGHGAVYKEQIDLFKKEKLKMEALSSKNDLDVFKDLMALKSQNQQLFLHLTKGFSF